MRFFLVAEPEDGLPPIRQEISAWLHYCFMREVRAMRAAEIYEGGNTRAPHEEGAASDPAAARL